MNNLTPTPNRPSNPADKRERLFVMTDAYRRLTGVIGRGYKITSTAGTSAAKAFDAARTALEHYDPKLWRQWCDLYDLDHNVKAIDVFNAMSK